MIQITNEDNMLLMARYPDNYFELAIVDPPYGIGMDNQKVRVKPNRPNTYLRANENQYNISNWDNEIPNKEYFNELFRVSKNQIIWGANYFCKFIPNGKGWIYWDKQMGDNNFSSGEFAFQSFQIKSSSYSFPSIISSINSLWSGLNTDTLSVIAGTQKTSLFHSSFIPMVTSCGSIGLLIKSLYIHSILSI